MPLNLHADCRARLDESVAKGLTSVKAKNGMFIERMSTLGLAVADFVLPQNGRLHDRLLEYIDSFPLSDFITETIGQELWEINRYLPDTTVALTDIEEYADPQAVTKRLLDDFESLPWSYQITIELPEPLNKLVPVDELIVELSPTVRLVRPNVAYDEVFPLDHSNKHRQGRLKGDSTGLLSSLLIDPQPAKWDKNRVYLQISVEGFIGQYGGSGTSQKAERALRSLCGLGIATNLFKVEYTYSSTPWKNHVYVHRKMPDGAWTPITRYSLGDAVARGISALKLQPMGGQLDTETKRNNWTHYRLKDAGAVLQAVDRTDQILLASQWLFDSHSGQDELLSFVQSMIVLEILLGDKSISDEIGIGELISNRFAYLIGTTHEQRASLLKEFKEIYRVRSQIVHSGKHRLTLDEHTLFGRLRWMGRRLIDKEVDLLKAGIVEKAEKSV